MRKILLAAAAALLSVGAFAQFRPSFIVNVGYQGANLMQKDVKFDLLSGLRAGVDVDMSVWNAGAMNLSVRPGLYYSMKGAAESDASLTERLHYIDIPILANLTFNAGGFGVFVNAGPYLGFGLGSSTKLGDITSDENLFGKDGIFNVFDIGMQMGAGAEWNNILLSIGTQFGIANLDKTVDKVNDVLGELGSDAKANAVRNQTFFITVGYRF